MRRRITQIGIPIVAALALCACSAGIVAPTSSTTTITTLPTIASTGLVFPDGSTKAMSTTPLPRMTGIALNFADCIDIDDEALAERMAGVTVVDVDGAAFPFTYVVGTCDEASGILTVTATPIAPLDYDGTYSILVDGEALASVAKAAGDIDDSFSVQAEYDHDGDGNPDFGAFARLEGANPIAAAQHDELFATDGGMPIVQIYSGADESELATFRGRLPWSSTNNNGFGHSYVQADFNADGYDDIAISNTILGRISIFFGTGVAEDRNELEADIKVVYHPGIPYDQVLEEQLTLYFGKMMAAGFIDQDGYADLVVAATVDGDTDRLYFISGATLLQEGIERQAVPDYATSVDVDTLVALEVADWSLAASAETSINAMIAVDGEMPSVALQGAVAVSASSLEIFGIDGTQRAVQTFDTTQRDVVVLNIGQMGVLGEDGTITIFDSNPTLQLIDQYEQPGALTIERDNEDNIFVLTAEAENSFGLGYVCRLFTTDRNCQRIEGGFTGADFRALNKKGGKRIIIAMSMEGSSIWEDGETTDLDGIFGGNGSQGRKIAKDYDGCFDAEGNHADDYDACVAACVTDRTTCLAVGVSSERMCYLSYGECMLGNTCASCISRNGSTIGTLDQYPYFSNWDAICGITAGSEHQVCPAYAEAVE